MSDQKRPERADQDAEAVEALARAAFEADEDSSLREAASGDGRLEPLEEFVRKYWQDAEKGHARPLGDYLFLFPGHDLSLAREYVALEGRHREVATGSQDPDAVTYGPYRVLQELGRGGQGAVYLAEDSRLRRNVALKVLRGLGSTSDDTVRRFQREAEIASRLDHPGICPVYDAGVEKGEPYIAMRHVEGETLARRIGAARKSRARGGSGSVVSLGTSAPTVIEPLSATSAGPDSGTATRLEIVSILWLFEKAARALHVAHEAGVVHRDIKPGNIMVTPAGDPVILDFGLARDLEGEEPSLTKTGALFGTPAYMSPEQLLAHRVRLDRRTDVYSLGVSLYEALTLQRPFDAPTRQGLYQAIETKEPRDPRCLNRRIPRDLRVVLATCLRKDRDLRYQTAEALAQDLSAVREGRPVAAKPVPVLTRAVLWARRQPAKASLLVAILVGLPILTLLISERIKNSPLLEALRLEKLQERKEGLLARGFSKLGDFRSERAIREFEAAARIEGGSVEATFGVAVAHLQSEKPRRALAVLAQSTQRHAQRTAFYLLRAEAHRRLGETSLAQELEGAAPEPRDALDYYFLGTRPRWRRLRDDRLYYAPARLAHRGGLIGRLMHHSAYRDAMRHLVQAIMLSRAPRALYYNRLVETAGYLRDKELVCSTARALSTLWPDSAVSWAVAGNAYIACAMPDAAIEALEEAIALNPDLDKAHHNLGAVLLDERRIGEAVQALREAVRLDAKDAANHNTLGWALAAGGRPDEALAAYRRAIDLDPHSGLLHANMAYVLADQGRIGEAIPIHREAVRLDPESSWIRLRFGTALYDHGRAEDAAAEFRAVLRLDPDSGEAQCRLGLTLKHAGRLEDAIVAYREAIRLGHEESCVYVNLGNALGNLGRTDQAIDAHRRATALDPDSANAHYCLASSLSEGGFLDDAIASGREARRLDPDSASICNNLAVDLAAKRQFDEALAVCREAVRLRPEDAGTISNLGSVLGQAGRWREAIQMFREALGRDPEHATSYHSLGFALRAENRYPEAIVALRQAILLEPDDTAAVVYLGLTLVAIGRFREATSVLRGAIESGRLDFDRLGKAREALLECAERAPLEKRLDAILAGQSDIEDVTEVPALAELCRLQQRPAAEVGLWQRAFARYPDLGRTPGSPMRFIAAQAALLAVMGTQQPAGEGCDQEPAALRAQALRWLREELETLEKAVRSGQISERRARHAIEHWWDGEKLATLRGGAYLSGLPEVERQHWKSFWTDVDELLEEIQ